MKFVLISSVAIAFALFTQTLSAQTSAKLPLPVQRLLRMEGKWAGPATIQMEGKTYKSTYYANFRRTADGNGLYMDEKCDIPGVAKLNGANLIGFNPFDGKIHWFSVDNLGTTHDHTGQFANDSDFSMEHQSMQDGKQYIEKIDVDFKDKNTLRLKLTATLDGKVQELIEATFKRQ